MKNIDKNHLIETLYSELLHYKKLALHMERINLSNRDNKYLYYSKEHNGKVKFIKFLIERIKYKEFDINE